MLFGDYVAQHPRWAGFKKIDNMATPSKAAGGTVAWINLPEIGKGQRPHADARQEQHEGRRGHPEVGGL